MAFFITVEGIDGAGKSTHLDFIAQYLQDCEYPCIQTREPGGTPLGEQLRGLLLHHEMHVNTETLLMFAARSEHLKVLIEPTLHNKTSVVCDRFTDASYAYQHGGKKIDIAFIRSLEKIVHPHLKPDLTFIFDLDPSIAKSRITGERDLDKFEKSSIEFFNGVRNVYLDLAKSDPRYFILDSTQSIETIQSKIKDRLDVLIK
jgi:dTMP kinase